MRARLDAVVARLLPGKWRRRASVAGVAVVVYALLGFLLVPYLLRRQVVAGARERLQRTATLAHARFNPFTLEARLIGFGLRDRDATPLAAFDTLVVNLELTSILRRAIVLKEFRLVRPAATARILASGRPAIADLFEPDSGAAADTLPPRIPRLTIHRLVVADGTITFRDESRSPVYAELFEDLGLTLDGFSTLPREEGDHLLTVTFASGASVQWSGSIVMQPVRLEGRVALERLRLPRISSVLGSRWPLQVTEGEGAATIEYLVDQAPGGRLQGLVTDASVTLTGVAVRPQGADSDWARVRSVSAQGIRAAWPARTYQVGAVTITSPWAEVLRRPDSTLNWTAVIQALTARDTVTRDSIPAWTGMISTVQVDSGALHLTDQAVQPAAELDVTGVYARIDSLGSDSTARFLVHAAAAIGPGAAVGADGWVRRSPASAELDLTVAGFDLVRLQPYLGAARPIRIDAGRGGLAGRLRVQPGRPTATFDGGASADGLETVSPNGARLIAWRALRASGLHVTTHPNLVRIRKVEVTQPFLRVGISREREVNLAALAGPRTDTAAAPFPYELVELTLADAEMDFEDLSLVLPFRARIHSATGALRDVASFGATPGSLEFEGRIEEDGRVRASGTLHVSDPYLATDIRADFRNVALPSLTPYSLEFAGYPVTNGRLDVDMEYRIQAGQLTAQHHIIASDLELGEKVEGGAVPGFAVKLALSLLKDSQGRIKLDPLVEGKVDDPQFRYSAVVWQVLKQMLGKIATAPFRFLGNLLGIGSDDIELVDFDPGSAEVIPPERTKLDTLAAELGRRPELTLSIEGRYDSVADGEAFREAALRRLIEARREGAAKAAERADTSVTALAKILEALYAEQFTPAALDSLRAANAADSLRSRMYADMRARLLAAQAVEPGRLVELGRQRAAAIAAELLAGGGLDASRVTVTEPAPAKRKKTGSLRVASEMSMDAH